MPKSNKPGWIDWRTSRARAILLEDLCPPDGILFGKDHISPETAWNFYKNEEGFKNIVVFDQFKDRLQGHRRQVKGKYLLSRAEEEALKHDREIHPRQDRNQRGQVVFDLHPAKITLREDVKEGKHENKTPAEFQMTREIYQQFDKKFFKHRLTQEIRRKKMIFHLEMKRQLQHQVVGHKRRPKGPSPFS